MVYPPGHKPAAVLLEFKKPGYNLAASISGSGFFNLRRLTTAALAGSGRLQMLLPRQLPFLFQRIFLLTKQSSCCIIVLGT
jgi:hypothetical protein